MNAYLNAVKTPDDLKSYALPSLPPDKDFVKSVETLISSAFLLGVFHASEEQSGSSDAINAADETDIPPIPFSEAVGFLKSKVPMTKTEWLSLEKKMRFRVFTMAKLGEVKVIETVKNQLVKAMESGEGFTQSFETVKAIAKASGETLTPFYWETVFRTNVQSAYVAGKLLQYQKFPPAAYRLLVIEDVRTSDICRHLLTQSGYGVVMPVDHPFWEKYGFPPYHMNCRTGISAVYDSQVGRHGNNVENRSMKSFEKFKVQDGFGGNPIGNGSFWLMSDAVKTRAREFGLSPDIVKFAHSLGLNNFDFEKAGNFGKPIQLQGTEYKVKVINGAKPKPKEILTSRALEENGHSVVMLPECGGEGISNPDALIDYDIVAEYKVPDGDNFNAIRRTIKAADEQLVTHMVFYPRTHNYTKTQALREINKRLKTTKRLKEVWLLWDGEEIIIKK